MTDLSSLCQLLCRLTSRPPPTPGSTSSSLPSASSSGPAPSGSTPSTLQQQLQQPLKLRQPVVGSGVGDVSSFVYPVLATLASYPTHLDRKAQVNTSSKIICLTNNNSQQDGVLTNIVFCRTKNVSTLSLCRTASYKIKILSRMVSDKNNFCWTASYKTLMHSAGRHPTK